ncbi:DUF917 family protein [Nocardioides sp. CCNWLW239]|uniref:S-methyl thiohydantoin desulfurase domain-containing protein n=1 Tax=Nocardioides sp. CCNWLW239 TaxID=3128902 RepID=UPI0030159026
MKRALTMDDIEAAVLGGAILGGGGGGFVEKGLRTAELALTVGTPQLWTLDEFDDDDLVATVALVGAPAAPSPLVTPRHLMRALELLNRELPGREIVAINSNENGAETTVNGWFQSAMSGLPVIDLACNGRAHPSSVMGAMGLHLREDYVSIQAYAGGHPHQYLEGATTGNLDATSGVVRRASMDAGGWVGVARNPVSVAYSRDHGAPGAITSAIELGRTYLAGGLDAAVEHLDGRIVTTGRVRGFACRQEEGLDVGVVTLDDTHRTALHFVNEYMVLEQGSTRISAFPDLIMTFVADGASAESGRPRPVPSGVVEEGMELTVVTVPAEKLILAETMFMPELYAPLEAALDRRFAPAVLAGA